MTFGLNEHTIVLLKNFFSRYPMIKKVKIYGSRAKGTHRKGSDIDFALFGMLDFSTVQRIAFELDALPTPYKFDITDYNTLTHEGLKEHIDRVGKVFYTRQGL